MLNSVMLVLLLKLFLGEIKNYASETMLLRRDKERKQAFQCRYMGDYGEQEMLVYMVMLCEKESMNFTKERGGGICSFKYQLYIAVF